MNNYICKIATKEEIEKIFDYEINIHPNDERWSIWKKENLKWFKEEKIIVYIGILNDAIICNATAMLDKSVVQNAGDRLFDDELVNKTTAYLSAFRTIEQYRGKGFFSALYKYMEQDLKKRGYKRLTIGVEPREVRTIKIYFKWGYDSFIKTGYETYPAKQKGEDEESIIVNYYYKELETIENNQKINYNNSNRKNGGNKMKVVKFFRCNKCGKIECVVEEQQKDLTCCGEQMEELKANTVDAAVEKHVPVYTIDGENVNVKVGDVEHPMTEEHYIMWIAYFDNNNVEFKKLTPTDKPEASFKKTEQFEIYAYCNLHGLWKNNTK